VLSTDVSFASSHRYTTNFAIRTSMIAEAGCPKVPGKSA